MPIRMSFLSRPKGITRVFYVSPMKRPPRNSRHGPKSLGIELLSSGAGLETLASHADVDIVLNGVVGFAGLRSTLAAAKAGKRIALANKESMVAGGELVNRDRSQGRRRDSPG